MLIVACVLKTGGWCAARDVERLRNSVAAHLTLPYTFVCLNDARLSQPSMTSLALRHGWPGWWSKMELFRPHLFDGASGVLYFDLDTWITGDLTQIALYAGCAPPFAMLTDWYRPVNLNSSVMLWTPGQMDFLHDCFAPRAEATIKEYSTGAKWGDQAFIQDAVGVSKIERLQTLFPQQFVSWKVHCGNGAPSGARVICFHGKPRIGEVTL